MNLIEQYLTILENSSETIYDNLINARKILVAPYLPSDEEYKRMNYKNICCMALCQKW